MTKRISVSLPDDVAARIEREKNQSAFVAETVREHMRGESIETLLAAMGVTVTPEGKARARARLDAARAAWTPERRAAMAARFGFEPGAAL